MVWEDGELHRTLGDAYFAAVLSLAETGQGACSQGQQGSTEVSTAWGPAVCTQQPPSQTVSGVRIAFIHVGWEVQQAPFSACLEVDPVPKHGQ